MVRVLAVLILAVSCVSSVQAATDLLALRVGVHPNKTRVVLELGDTVPYKAFTLPDPYRVVIDIPEVRWLAGETLPRLPVGVVRDMRFGRFEPGTMRIVLDLDRPVLIERAFALPPKEGKRHRLVLDLIAVTRPVYMAGSSRKTFQSAEALAPPRPTIATLQPRRKPSNTLPMIVVDPGHGGIDPGATSVTGKKEKALTLVYGKALRDALLKSNRYRVKMTRSDDRFVKLRDRMEIAQRAGGDLFISLHANTHNSKKIRGASIYTVSEKASDAEAARIAETENAADIIAGVNFSQHPEDVRDILLDLTWRETKNLSKRFAHTMITEVGTVNSLLPNSHRFAGFAVLKSPTVPSVLFEIGYMSNPKEARTLETDAHKRKVISAIMKAIDRYFEWQQMVGRS
jgi:N-acetylmuramoyl-L-alanine amidase